MKFQILFLISFSLSHFLFAQDTLSNKQQQLKEVKIGNSSGGTEFKEITPVRIEKLNHYELKKNACCNLAESFESSPTVEVSFSNALTGTRQIQLLGLSGVYVQQLTDLLPTIRGLNYTYGLDNIPSSQADAIYINKGPGSVTNGFESITGQIDIELQKPEKTPRFFVYAYVNSQQRAELNLQFAKPINQRWDASLFVHGNWAQFKTDVNNDGFMDGPLNKQLSFIQRWKYNSFRNIESQFGVKAWLSEKTGGELNFQPTTTSSSIPNYYGFVINTKRAEVFNKTSYNFDEHGDKTMGLQSSLTNHQINARYGANDYTGHQSTVYLNFIYQKALGSESHVLRTGASVLGDYTNENYKGINYQQNTTTPGVYAEYTYIGSEVFSLLGGARLDYLSNQHQVVFTPRFNIKYSITKSTSVRASAGTGFRNAFIFAENPQLFVSSRHLVILEQLKPERASNVGLNITQKIKSSSHFSVDLFRTDFQQQVVADYDWNPQTVYFYNLKDKSFSTYLQTELYLEISKNLHLRFAYKYNQVKTTFHGILLDKALNPNHRALGNIAYDSKNGHFKYDFTTQWVGEQRLYNYSLNPEAYRMPEKSPSFFRLLGQVTYLYKHWEWFMGSENMTNFTQKQVIIDPANPFGGYFDSGSIWGPVMGRTIYMGCRWTLK
jgi:outer membrane receptor for ferrienterochelin and colicins